MDKERTKAYYAALPPDELCGCEYCRNFAAHVAGAYPLVAAYLEGLGVSIEKTFESFPSTVKEHPVHAFIRFTFIDRNQTDLPA